jgi:hypothetical protein
MGGQSNGDIAKIAPSARGPDLSRHIDRRSSDCYPFVNLAVVYQDCRQKCRVEQSTTLVTV